MRSVGPSTDCTLGGTACIRCLAISSPCKRLGQLVIYTSETAKSKGTLALVKRRKAHAHDAWNVIEAETCSDTHFEYRRRCRPIRSQDWTNVAVALNKIRGACCSRATAISKGLQIRKLDVSAIGDIFAIVRRADLKAAIDAEPVAYFRCFAIDTRGPRG